MKKFYVISFLLFNLFTLQSQESSEKDHVSGQAVMDSIENAFHYEYGKIELENGLASLDVPEGYKFLNSEQSNYVLTDLWGNPPSETMGLLFPEDISPLSDDFTYVIEISYSKEGFIDDEDAKDIDYDELLEEMRESTIEESKERIKQGYESLEFIGWAAAPFYDENTKKLHWAQELKFGETETTTLNYNIRVLGREGYLNLNAIGDIDVLPKFENNIDEILASVTFNDGYKYSDFDPEIDKVAAYGIGGLIAGKVLAKAGVFAVLLKFWKVIAIGAAGIFAGLRKKFFGNKEKEA